MFHIFIVDENAAVSALLLLAFKRAQSDSQVYTLSDSRILPAYLDNKSPVEALRGGAHPQLLILQMEMSFYSGLETLAWIRGQTRFDAMFVVMLNSVDNPSDRERAQDAGADAYLIQPEDNKELPRLAKEIISLYTSARTGAPAVRESLKPELSLSR